MKNYEVTLVAHYAKTVSIHADSPEQAEEKLKTVLFDTDLVKFSQEDFVCGEAEINDPMEDAGEEIESEGEDFEDGCCSECPCFRTVCKGCCHEGGD
ncbi:hypothetical protein AALC25_20110 [Lachnospiraceae bacterium 29-84]